MWVVVALSFVALAFCAGAIYAMVRLQNQLKSLPPEKRRLVMEGFKEASELRRALKQAVTLKRIPVSVSRER